MKTARSPGAGYSTFIIVSVAKFTSRSATSLPEAKTPWNRSEEGGRMSGPPRPEIDSGAFLASCSLYGERAWRACCPRQ